MVSMTSKLKVMRMTNQRTLNSQTCASALSALAILVAVAALFVAPAAGQQSRAAGATVNSFYDLKTNTLEGKPADLAMYRGKVSLVERC